MSRSVGTSIDQAAGGVPIVPDFDIVREIGRGANGVVYEAKDALLGRSVAIKVWNERGRSRAQSETAKIAALNHPLVVTTHRFGTVDSYPFAVMELVPGSSGKTWMKSAPALQARLKIWRMYVRGLRHLHTNGVLHGDPHLGNLIVFEDPASTYSSGGWRDRAPFAMKLADTGTSEFWIDESKFAAREASLIRETAGKMFSAESFAELAEEVDGFDYEQMLTVCDTIVSCIDLLNGVADDRLAQVAEAVVDTVMDAPFFNLDVLYRQVYDSPTTGSARVVSRLNGALQGLRERWTGDKEITETTRRMYADWRRRWRQGERAKPRSG